MKKYFKIILPLIAVALGLASCLKQGAMNVDPNDLTGKVVTLQFIENGSGTTINSGMQYFSGGALTYPGTDEKDTAHYNVAISGVVPSSDIAVTIGVDQSKVLDHFSTDSIAYELMPDSLYDFVATSGVIKAGTAFVPMEIVFYPSKIDITKSYMLPVVVTDASGQTISSNFGTIYFHVIGNPLAGTWGWDFIRKNNQDGSGAPAGGSFTGETTVFSPVNPTSIKMPTGYYVQPNYLLTFKNAAGVLSEFNAVIAPDEIKGAFTDNGITMVTQPTVVVNADYTHITINYVVFNGSAFRNCTDIYYK
ncbi:DUF1735 domain-containing protein [Flavihumibacter profundi]|jgi:hypothetical protein|uniref:DUF1735 domain-containing protein n=1 Tax=Flavihumibacter profundi TaxID=2716883 RepID=UPI001CC508A2|nr:DUF1735 domain-containing protein [Flavihumibacter profundi]MBZ5857123.1 DUF1735 domain-containing protein [Flavihumibacter profundi]